MSDGIVIKANIPTEWEATELVEALQYRFGGMSMSFAAAADRHGYWDIRCTNYQIGRSEREGRADAGIDDLIETFVDGWWARGGCGCDR